MMHLVGLSFFSHPAIMAPMIEKHTTQLNQLQRLINEVDKATTAQGGPAVGEFLAAIMMGRDPRPIESDLFVLVKRISFREFSGGGANFPTEEEWQLLVDIVLGSGLYEAQPVSVEQSQKAAEKLMEYLHAKMKSVETQGTQTHQHEVGPVTGKVLDAFLERFENEF